MMSRRGDDGNGGGVVTLGHFANNKIKIFWVGSAVPLPSYTLMEVSS